MTEPAHPANPIVNTPSSEMMAHHDDDPAPLVASLVARLIEISGGYDGRETILPQPIAIIGRDHEGLTLTLDTDRWVSRTHARIAQQDGHWVLIDLGSSNGTWMQGEQLDPQQEYPLLPNTMIRMGHTEFLFVVTPLP